MGWRVIAAWTSLAFLTLWMAVSPAQAGATTLYVSASASADPACHAASQANPFATIAGALGCLAKSGAIKIGAGTFAGGFTITKNVTLTGVGPSTVIANPGAAQLSLTEVTIADGHTVTLSGLTVNGDGEQRDVTMGSGALNVVNSTLTGGLTFNAGPAITEAPGSGQSNLTVLRSSLTNNHGLEGGSGAIFANSSSTSQPPNVVSIIDSTIADNRADGSGGGVAMGLFDVLNIRDSTISGNEAANGGGIFVNGSAGATASTTTLTNALIAGNTIGGFANRSGADCADAETVTDGGHNVLGVQDGCNGINKGIKTGINNGIDGDQAGTATAPLAPDLGPLTSGGTQPPTLPLLAGSPAINAGDASDCAASPVNGTDQRNVTRNVKTRFACDVGAYDTSKPLQTLYVKHSTHADPACASASSTNPFSTIAGALACSTSGTEVKIAAGTFAGGFTVAHNVVLLGAGPTTVISTPATTEVTVADGQFVTLENLVVNGGGSAGTNVQQDVRAGNGALNIITSTLTGGVASQGAGVGLVPGSGTGNVMLLRSTVANNVGLNGVGGIFVADGPGSPGGNVLSVINSTVANNQGVTGGGIGAGGSDETLILRDSTISGNRASDGGGIYASAGDLRVTLTDVVLAGNTGGSEPDCQAASGVTSGGDNVLGVQNSSCPGITNGFHGDQAGTPTSPLNPLLGPLANNGGPTQTMALLAGSPARSAGDPEDCSVYPVSNIDQRGDKRNAASRLTCDVGAYDTGS
jgi:hypothetical protein